MSMREFLNANAGDSREFADLLDTMITDFHKAAWAFQDGILDLEEAPSWCDYEHSDTLESITLLGFSPPGREDVALPDGGITIKSEVQAQRAAAELVSHVQVRSDWHDVYDEGGHDEFRIGIHAGDLTFCITGRIDCYGLAVADTAVLSCPDRGMTHRFRDKAALAWLLSIFNYQGREAI
jgi:hypothetical protein